MRQRIGDMLDFNLISKFKSHFVLKEQIKVIDWLVLRHVKRMSVCSKIKIDSDHSLACYTVRHMLVYVHVQTKNFA